MWRCALATVWETAAAPTPATASAIASIRLRTDFIYSSWDSFPRAPKSLRVMGTLLRQSQSNQVTYAPSLKLGASRATPAIAGVSVLRRSPRLKISNAEAWSRMVSKPQAEQWCFLSHNFFGTARPHGHCCDVPRAFTFTSHRPALSALYDSFRMKPDHAASCTDLASVPPAKPWMFKSSTAMMP